MTTTAPLWKKCPSCGKVLKIKGELLGKNVKCSKCRSALRWEGGNLVVLKAEKPKPKLLAEDENLSGLAIIFAMLGFVLIVGCLVGFGKLRLWSWEDWGLYVGLPLGVLVCAWIMGKIGGRRAPGAGLDHWEDMFGGGRWS